MSVPQDLVIDMTLEETAAYFTGTWYEMVRSNVRFERGCADATAQYTYGDVVQIVNNCTRTPRRSSAKLTAVKRDPNSPKASFKVGMTPLRLGTYNILHNKGGLAVVAGRSFSQFWVLARDPAVSKEAICAVLEPFYKYLDGQTLVFNDGEECLKKDQRGVKNERRD